MTIIGFDDMFEAIKEPASFAELPFAFPDLAEPNPFGRVDCTTAQIDDHGRLSNRSTVRALRWSAGQHVSFQSDGSFILVRQVEQSRWTVGRGGYLRLPAEYRNMCSLTTGNQAFLAAAPAYQLMLVVPIPLVAAALWRYRPEMWEVAQ